jgi:hypothetical protein
VAELSEDDGYVHINKLQRYVNNQIPDFDPRNYGFSKFRYLLKELPDFWMDYRGPANNPKEVIYVGLRSDVKGGNGSQASAETANAKSFYARELAKARELDGYPARPEEVEAALADPSNEILEDGEVDPEVQRLIEEEEAAAQAEMASGELDESEDESGEIEVEILEVLESEGSEGTSASEASDARRRKRRRGKGRGERGEKAEKHDSAEAQGENAPEPQAELSSQALEESSSVAKAQVSKGRRNQQGRRTNQNSELIQESPVEVTDTGSLESGSAKNAAAEAPSKANKSIKAPKAPKGRSLPKAPQGESGVLEVPVPDSASAVRGQSPAATKEAKPKAKVEKAAKPEKVLKAKAPKALSAAPEEAQASLILPSSEGETGFKSRRKAPAPKVQPE